MKKILCLLFACSFAGFAQAQVILDNFSSGTPTGAEVIGTTWVGQVTPNGSTITVGGTAKDDNGWGTTGASIDATGMSFVTFIAQRDSGNLASSLTIQFEDINVNTQVYSVSTSAFNVGSLTTVNIALAWTTPGFDITQITGWNIGGGTTGISTFHMTFDNLALTAVPEPSTYAAIAGALSLGFVAWRRRRAVRA